MTDISTDIDNIKKNAQLVLSMARDKLGEDVALDENGVRWLNGFIQRQHEQGELAIRSGLISTLGSFLGECIVECYGGEWKEVDGMLAVAFDERHAVFPFNKVAKHLDGGADDSVLSFFTTIPVVFAR
jgi:hypothetical protein